ncbi:G-protein coupled receptor GRL101-like [Clavelina lepadiformis]|uniref:G-protein coupled receptor GRL101-like n=1 Tax=Clavelina lepadiformis TaxID=159417 RepID=UPI004041D157
MEEKDAKYEIEHYNFNNICTILFLMGLIAIIGNVIVIVSKCKSLFNSGRTMSKVEKIYASMVLSLSMADLLMGVYCFALGIAGMYKVFDSNEDKCVWKSSSICTALGIINFISSQISVTTLVIISSVRVVSVWNPFKMIKIKTVYAAIINSWIIWIFISLLPVFQNTGSGLIGFYKHQIVCTMSYIAFRNNDSMPLTVFVLVYNLTAFLLIFLFQLAIYYKTLPDISSFPCNCCGSQPAVAMHPRRRNEDVKMHRRLFFIVVSDFLCWVPVITISLYVWTESYVKSKCEWHEEVRGMMDWFSYVLVIFIPINSALNPVLYSSRLFGLMFRNLCKLPCTKQKRTVKVPEIYAVSNQKATCSTADALDANFDEESTTF